MNSLVGKSTGIALLLAAGLLAALFAMGVFSATGVGAGEHITATAELVDLNTPVTDPASDDTLRISVSGLIKLSPNNDNEIVITMTDDLGTTSGVTLLWKGGEQGLETVPIEGAYATGADGATGSYTFEFGNATTIESGDAVMEITSSDHSIDSNTRIDAITIGNGDAGDPTLLTIEYPDGLAIANAPPGPSIALSPEIGAVGPETMQTHSCLPAIPTQYL